MLSSLALTRVNGLRVNLPKTNTMPPEPSTKIMLTITADQRLYLNEQELGIESLQSQLSSELANFKSDPESTSFIINADASVPHGLVVRAIDISRLAGISHFAIATAPENPTK